jgi:hypothetical protein
MLFIFKLLKKNNNGYYTVATEDEVPIRYHGSSGGSSLTYLIATLPVSSAGTYDALFISGIFGTWTANETIINLVLRNRSGFKCNGYISKVEGDAIITAYSQNDGSVNVYLTLNTYCTYDLMIYFLENAYSISMTSASISGTLVWSSATMTPMISGSLSGNTLSLGSN